MRPRPVAPLLDDLQGATQIRLSNSQVSSGQVSSGLAKRFPAGVFRSPLRCALPTKARSASLLPTKGRSPSSLPKEGAERRLAHIQCGVLLRRARNRSCDRPVSPYGAPPRRFQSLGPRLPLTGGVRRFRRRGPDGRKERALGVILRREADPGTPGTPGTPGSTVCETMRAGAAPHSRSDRLENAPQRIGMIRKL